MCLWVPTGFVQIDGSSCRITWNILGKATITVHFAPPVTLILLTFEATAETAGVMEETVSMCLFLLFSSPSQFQGYGSKDNAQWNYGNGLPGRELKAYVLKVLDSPLSRTQKCSFCILKHFEEWHKGPESSEVPPLFASPWCTRRDNVKSSVLSYSPFDTWTLCNQDGMKIKSDWTAKGS